MGMNYLSRTEMILGETAIERLGAARVAVFGIGGVGGYAVEALVRSGIGAVDLIDDDKVCITNINRQLHATTRTAGKYKVDVCRDRVLDINPKCVVKTYKCFYMPDTAEQFDFAEYDYVIDAVDTVTAKVDLVLRAQAVGTRIISAMGAGNKLDPTMFRVADIYKTRMCPLARVMRKELKTRGVKTLKVVYSEEEPIHPITNIADNCRTNCVCPPGTRKCTVRRDIPGSNAFTPSVMGLIIGGEVVKDIVRG
jgi:tRNA A37 threonylcarbamoyladenosine dehydratase